MLSVLSVQSSNEQADTTAHGPANVAADLAPYIQTKQVERITSVMITSLHPDPDF